MLPKEDKIKKPSDEKQPGLFDKEDEKKRLANKRRFIIIALTIFVGFPLSLLTYRSFKNFNLSFNVPKLSFNLNTSKSVSSIKIPTNDTWSLYVIKTNSESVDYQKNQDLIFNNQNLNSILDRLDSAGYSNNNIYTSNLPQGLKIKEITDENDTSFSYFSKIITPSQELILLIKISDSQDLTRAKTSVSDLIGQLYWYSLQK